MKQKTKQAAKKRFHISSTGKARRRRARQSHFNARATGDETRGKHHDRAVSAADIHRLDQLLPYD